MCEIHPMTSRDQSHTHVQGIRLVIVIAHHNTTRKEIAKFIDKICSGVLIFPAHHI